MFRWNTAAKATHLKELKNHLPVLSSNYTTRLTCFPSKQNHPSATQLQPLVRKRVVGLSWISVSFYLFWYLRQTCLLNVLISYFILAKSAFNYHLFSLHFVFHCSLSLSCTRHSITYRTCTGLCPLVFAVLRTPLYFSYKHPFDAFLLLFHRKGYESAFRKIWKII